MSRQPDPYANYDLDQLEEIMNNLQEQVKEAKMRRNFVQQEREMINSFYEISVAEHEKIKKEIEKEEYRMQEMENRHREDINGFINKFRHLEYDHDIFITENLERSSKNALTREEEIRAEREKQYLNKKKTLKNDIKTESQQNRDEVQELNTNNESKYNAQKLQLEEHLKKIKRRYEEDKIKLEKDLELRLKVEIHELEERKNMHINNLMKAFEERMDAWKKENIDQIKENIGLIKSNNENFKTLKKDNEELDKEVEELRKKILNLETLLEEAQDENSQILNRLAKYYNQDINVTNMNAKVTTLIKKCDDVVKKTDEIESKKKTLIDEIKELKEKFVDAVMLFKTKSEKTNDELDKKISHLNDNYTKREIQIEEFLKNVDMVAEGDININNNMNNINHLHHESKSGFGREMYLEMFEHIRAVLTTKTQIIKNLKYSLELATKAFNDTMQVYETKLIEFGIPADELGFHLLESNTSNMPAGLVSA